MLRIIRMMQTANRPIATIVCESEEELEAFDSSGLSATSVAYVCSDDGVKKLMLSPSRNWVDASAVAKYITVGPTQIATFTTLRSAPLRSLTVDIEPVQDLHGYDNPWPAGGGVNIMPPGQARDVTFAGIRYQSDGKGTYHISGTSTGEDAANFVLDMPFTIPPSSTHKCMFMNSAAESHAVVIFKNGETAIDSWSLGQANKVSTTYSTMGGKECDRIAITVNETGVTVDMTIRLMFVPQSASPTSFIPYSNICPISGWSEAKVWVQPTHDTSANPTVTIDLDGTRYGGTLDVLTGVLTVDSKLLVADGTTVKTTGGYGAGGPNWLPAIVLSQADYVDASIQSTGMLANYLVGSTNVTSTENSVAHGNAGKVIALHIGTMQGTDGTHGYNSAAEVQSAVNAYLADHNLQVWYKLATPITVQLTANEVTALLGTNNVWADTGDVTVEYRSN